LVSSCESVSPTRRVARNTGHSCGSVLEELGDLERGREHLQPALEIFEAAYARDHSKVAKTLNKLGSL
jgi:hypothetical protein